MRTILIASTAAVLCLTLPPHGAVAQLLKKEPALGKMKEGQRVLVDDGTCPKGQVKEVIGGNHTKVGGTKKVERTRRCIARP